MYWIDFSQDTVNEIAMRNAEELLGLLPDQRNPFAARTDELEATLLRRVPEFSEAVSEFHELLKSGQLARMLPQLGVKERSTVNAVRKGGK